MRTNSWQVLAAAIGAIMTTGCVAPALSDPPAQETSWNIVLILVDDLGWTDLGVMGSTFYETPNIDRLADEGMRFTNAYAATTVCSPTRASILTGQYPARLHVTDWIRGHERPWAKLRVPDWLHRLPRPALTIAEALGRAGYVSAPIGKWHLGDASSRPETHGFDLNVAGDHRGQPPSYHAPFGIPTLKDDEPDGEDEPDGDDDPDGAEYLTDRLTDEAITFVSDNRDHPFFLYLPYYTVHTPIEPEADRLMKYEAKATPVEGHWAQRNPGYAAMIESLDDGVGRLLEALDTVEIADRTVVIFASDNGGLVLPLSPWGRVTSNWPLRSGKGSAYEGGVRVPFIVRWPGATAPGAVDDTLVISADILPTILEITGERRRRPVDGSSLVSLLRGEGPLDREALYWHYPHYHPGGAAPYGAVRAGRYKLIEYYEDMRVELYDLDVDVGEAANLAETLPKQTARLRGLLHAWRNDMGAQMPSENPDYDPERAETFTR